MYPTHHDIVEAVTAIQLWYLSRDVPALGVQTNGNRRSVRGWGEGVTGGGV